MKTQMSNKDNTSPVQILRCALMYTSTYAGSAHTDYSLNDSMPFVQEVNAHMTVQFHHEKSFFFLYMGECVLIKSSIYIAYSLLFAVLFKVLNIYYIFF